MKRRNKFSLSHHRLLTAKMGYLFPIANMEVLPGDTLQMSSSAFIRFAPMVAPVMTPVIAKIHHFFVPFRLIWKDFEDFITGGPDGRAVPIPPNFYYTGGSLAHGTLGDYLGIPPFEAGTFANKPIRISSLYHRAYRLIWNEWYRDQNLQDELPLSLDSGQENTNVITGLNNLCRSAWDKDYFTTASPWEQKGLAVNVPVNGTPSGTIAITGAPSFSGSASGGESGGPLKAAFGAPNGIVFEYSDNDGFGQRATISANSGTLAASFTGAGSLGNIDLNQFREAMAMQRFEEHRALYGSRYVEYLRYLGVKASDARLQRPEYLGGGRSVIQFSEVLQTAQDGDTPVGTMRGHGIGAMRTNRFRRFFEEHGIVMSLMSVRPRSIYAQGLPRKFSKVIKTDFWQKELEHIGQQEVLNKEVYMTQDNHANVFGYQDRYNEYRSEPSTVHGEFRDLLNYWHLGREFSAPPTLNGDFISSLPSDRIFADQTGNDTMYIMVHNSVQARRMISKRGNPR